MATNDNHGGISLDFRYKEVTRINQNKGGISLEYSFKSYTRINQNRGGVCLMWSPLPYYNPIVRTSQIYTK